MGTTFTKITEFENAVADFFGAPYAVAVDSCTHGLELCLRLSNADFITVPCHTYVSVPMLANKLNIDLDWGEYKWEKNYNVYPYIIDAATFWQKGGYEPNNDTLMCISFQYQKHLSLGRGGMILCDDEGEADELRRMAYDGREFGIHWREQNIKTMGYHYYMTPETAELGLQKLPEAIKTPPRIWSWKDYPDVSQFDVFK